MKSPRHCRDVVLLDHTGQLGNRLILMSHFIAAAEEFGFRVHDFALAPHRKNFAGLVHNPFFTYPARHVGWDAGAITKALRKPLASWLQRRGPVLEGKEGWLGYFNANHRPSTRLDGEVFARWMGLHRVFIPWGYDYRCPSWVAKHQEKIRAFLKPVGPSAIRAQSFLRNLRASGRTPIGVHLRLGKDYQEFFYGKWHFPVEIYVKLMKRYQAFTHDKEVVFVICSDIQLNPKLFENLPVSIDYRKPFEDFCLLSGCERVIGTVSSFNQMACFLGQRPLFVLQDAHKVLDSLEDFRIPELGGQLLPL